MKFTISIEINKPIEEVASLFDNEENLLKWIIGLEKIEHLSGEKGKPGAISKMIFQLGKKKMELLERIESMNFPGEMVAHYESPGALVSVKTRFIDIGNRKTEYFVEKEFQFSGIMKIVGFFTRSRIKKQSIHSQKAFKAFAESQ